METHDELMCVPVKLAYDWDTRTGTLVMLPEHCCDMTGCLNVFRRIDPEVERIETFSGVVPDTVYSRRSGMWVAYEPIAALEGQ